ncbi:MAG: proton-conducting transporter membrane subunit, partial [Terrimicrobiaceae bacterium]
MLLLSALALPVALLLACLRAGLRQIIPKLLWVAPVPALAASLFGTRNSPVVLSGEPYQVTLMLDASGSMLLTAASLLWIAAGFYAPAFFRREAVTGSFTVCWLFTLIGSLGIFLAADLVTFFLFYALVSLPAYGLVICDGTPAARRAGAIYMGFALLGENLLLMGFVLLAANTDGSLRIADVADALQTAPSRYVILPLLIAGFGMKIALLPMHFWMPLSYAASPIPAAAVLSGAAVKAGVIGLIRFLPFGMALPGWGELLTIVGFCGAFYGVGVGITQNNPKTVLAYSSVSQMGFLAAVLGMGLAAGDKTVASLVAFYAAHHVLVKGALFLAVGVAALTAPQRIGLVVVPGVVIALGLAGLPLTGGALAKLAVKDPLGYGVAATLASLSACGTTLLMLHFLHRLVLTAGRESAKPAETRLVVSWLAMAVASIAVPWIMYPLAGFGFPSDALAPAALWKVLWPVLLGGVLTVGLWRWGHRLPRIPEGDVVVASGAVARVAAASSAMLERWDSLIRQWAVASLSLLVVALLLALAMLAD